VPGQWSVGLDENFQGTTLDGALWNTQYPWGEDNNGDGSENCYLPTNAVLDGNGHLVLTGRQGLIEGTSSTGQPKSWPYNSGQVNTYGKFALEYGALEMRARVPAGPGVWPAFWALPADGSWPPEVDVMEIYGSMPNVLEMTYHRGTPDNRQVEYQKRTLARGAAFSDRFHIYGCDIAPDAITWYLDGVRQWSFGMRQDIVTQLKPLYIVCNFAVGGLGGDPGLNTWPQSYVVDYIRAWHRSDAG